MFSRCMPARSLILGVAATLLLALFAGCNTMEGAGQDIEEGGEAIQDAAD